MWETCHGSARPDICPVVLEFEKTPDILRVPDAFEGTHVFATGCDKGALNALVDIHDPRHHEFLLCDELIGGLWHLYEVSPEEGWIGDVLSASCGDFLVFINVEVLLEEFFCPLLCLDAVKHHVEGILVASFRIYAIGCKSTTKTIGAVVHQCNGLNDGSAAYASSCLTHHSRDCTARGDIKVALHVTSHSLALSFSQ